MSKPSAVLWDMDGTLVDTEPYWIAAEIDLAEKSGGSWSHEDALTLVGLPLLKSAHILQTRGGIKGTPEEIVETLLQAVAKRMIDEGIPWRAGAKELLTALVEAGVPCALVTMSYGLLADVLVGALPQGTFGAVVTGDMVQNGKPDPEPYLLAASLLEIDITSAVAIEDSIPGVASAEAAGAKTIAVPHLVPIPPLSGRSRVNSLVALDLSALRDIAGGKVIDLLA